MREALRRLEGDGHVMRDSSGGVRPEPAARLGHARALRRPDRARGPRGAHARTRTGSTGSSRSGSSCASEHDDGPDFVYADEGFHEGIARASGNSATERYIRDINERIRLIRIHDFTTPDRIEATIEEHLEILEAVRAGRADAAAALMRVHIERCAEVVERRVGELLARMFEEERP